MYITYTLDGYTKDKNTGPGNYITAGEKPIKVNLYRTSIITINILNGPDTIILTNTVYYSIFFTNIISAKCFQLKKVYLNKKHSQLHKKRVI